MSSRSPIFIATRGSALALAQANMVLAQCQTAFPKLSFELKIIKTTGDKLQTASLAQEGNQLPKGLFTKELEVALLENKADLAVHSLKDLPVELPTGLKLGAVGKRADVRDVLLYRNRQAPIHTTRVSGADRRGFEPGLKIQDLPTGAAVATSSTRRRAQLLAINSQLKSPDIRGNVLTRLQKLAEKAEIDGTLLALAGMTRLGYRILEEGQLEGKDVPSGLLGSILDTELMLPCVGQGAIGIEIRDNDQLLGELCQTLNDYDTYQSVSAERAFLAEMGGGCQSPVAAYARIENGMLSMQAVSFASGPVRRAREKAPIDKAVGLGRKLAAELK